MRVHSISAVLTVTAIAIVAGCSSDDNAANPGQGSGGSGRDAGGGGASGRMGSSGGHAGSPGGSANAGSTSTGGAAGSSGAAGTSGDSGTDGSAGAGGAPGDSGTDGSGGAVDGCAAARSAKSSAGCDYYATNMDRIVDDACFAVFVVNASTTAAHLQVSYAGTSLPVADFTRIPAGKGATQTYAAFDAAAGLAPGKAAILFLGGSSAASAPCPVPAAVPTGSNVNQASGIGHSFHITADVPVTAYEMNPYGLAASIPGASLLLPTTAWDTNYVAVTAAPFDVAAPSLNIVAAEDDTTVTMLPVAAVQGGGALPAGAQGTAYTFKLNRGEQAQFSQAADLSGSAIRADKPVGVMAGQACMTLPTGAQFCDHAEQMLPPVKATGHEYAAVMFRPRVTGDAAYWHVVGMVDGTALSYSAAVGGPLQLNASQSATFVADQPFVVQSQDADHPFLLFAEMTGSESLAQSGYGDPDFVLEVPPDQFQTAYHFYADPSFPETNLVLVRAKSGASFADVTLDCAGVIGGWQALGAYEWARVDLTRHDFANVGSCSSGYHTITSAAPFGLWVWGWGTPETTTLTSGASYGYPAGMSVRSINSVTVSAGP